jgi:hypothetical protein
MTKTTPKHTNQIKQATPEDREIKIFNIMTNTSVLLMALMTEAFSDLFSTMAEGMTQAITSGFGASEKDTQETSRTIKKMKTELPQHMIKEMVAMKKDITNQLLEKKQELRNVIADPMFDNGITIAEKYSVGLPAVTNDLDERTLLSYIALMKANDPSCTKMFQELMEWMKVLPQPPQDKSGKNH